MIAQGRAGYVVRELGRGLIRHRALCLTSVISMASILLIFLLFLMSAITLAQGAGPANVYPMQEGFVDAQGVMIYYKILGRGEPLMIVHGGPGASHDYFLPYLLPLARHHKLIFIDERGSGRSQKLEDASGYTIETMVEDVEAVRQALGLGKISLLGHSYGGCLAQAYALKYQKNLWGLRYSRIANAPQPSRWTA